MTRTIKLNLREIKELECLLKEHDRVEFKNTRGDYEIFRVITQDGQIIAYNSGKIVMNTDLAFQLVSDIIQSHTKLEKTFDFIIGSDETGKGEWYGPLVAVAIGLNPKDVVDFRLAGVMDSKELSKDNIIRVGRFIRDSSNMRASRVLSPKGYNDLYNRMRHEGKNLNDLLAWAHTAAIRDLLEIIPDAKTEIIIDKFDIKATDLRLEKVREYDVKIIQKSKAESEIPVAAASILAKLIYEEEVDALDKQFGLDLRNSQPTDIPKEILFQVAKLHFKNVQKVMKD